MAAQISLTTGSWNGDRTVLLAFPDNWTVERVSGVSLPAASPEEIDDAFDSPVESYRLSHILRGKTSVAVVVDDHTRPTPVFGILTEILKEVRQAGIPECNVKVIVALGTHVLTDGTILRQKLGSIMDSGVKLVLPDCRNSRDYVEVGRSGRNIPIYVHREYATADVRITVSGIYPHDEAGFSGGAKILIGVLGLSTISRFHRGFAEFGRGRSIETPFRNETESFADSAGIDFSVNVVLNHSKQIHRLWCGDFRAAFRKAAGYASACLSVEATSDADVVISNAYPLDTSMSVLGKSLWPFGYARRSARRIVVASPVEYSDSRIPFCSSRGESWRQTMKKLLYLSQIKRLLLGLGAGVRYRARPGRKWEHDFVLYLPIEARSGAAPRIIRGRAVFTSWERLMRELAGGFPDGFRAKVLVYDYAPLHYPCSSMARQDS